MADFLQVQTFHIISVPTSTTYLPKYKVNSNITFLELKYLVCNSFQWIVFQCIFIEPKLSVNAVHSTFSTYPHFENNDLTKFMHETLGTQVDGSPQKGFKMVHSVRS